jgi:glutaconate CoA-transferase, subunit A
MRWIRVEEVRALVPDGAMVAIGGSGLQRKPMGLLRALVDAGVRDLRVVSFLGSVDVELLLASGVTAEVHTAGVSLEGAGLAPRYRSARQAGEPRVVEWSEGALHAALEASGRGVPSLPCATSPRSAVVARNPHLKVAADPFTGQDVVFAEALPVDVALLHVSGADEAGNLHIDGDPSVDGTLARSARTVVASASQRRSGPPAGAKIPRIWVDAVVELPAGAWPTGCHAAERVDDGAVRAWAASKGSDPGVLRPEGSGQGGSSHDG